MMSTRAASKRTLSANIKNRVVKRQKSPRAPSKPGRAGRKPTHDERALIATGVKLAMPNMELKPTVIMVNHVCNNPVNADYPGASEEALNVRTLRKRVVALMKAPWKALGPQHVAKWEALVSEPIKELVFEVCARIKHDEDYAKLKNTTVVRQSVRAVVQVEVAQKANALDNNFGYNMVFPYLHLEPQQEPVQQPQQQPQQQLQLPGGGGSSIPQLDSFSGFNICDAEMDLTTYGAIDDDIDFDWLRGLNLE